MENKYPECDKIVANHDKSQAIGNFLDWLEEHGIRLGRWEPTDAQTVINRMAGRRNYDEKFVEFFTSKEKLLADYFEIDLNKVEIERRALLENIRKEAK